MLTKPDHPEIGRVLAVRDLSTKTIVWVHKQGRPLATMWVVKIEPEWLTLYAGVTRMTFKALRCGDSITDDDGAAMALYEYLGQ